MHSPCPGSDGCLQRCAAAHTPLPSCHLISTPCLHALPQGLWHPARKVRQVYWRLYNNLYIGAQDALVACYPRMQDDGINTYKRHELDVFI